MVTKDTGDDDGTGKTPRRPSKRSKVGHGSPPMDHCFRPGQSGNPKGRPKGSKNKPVPLIDGRFDDIIVKEAFRMIKVKDGGRTTKVTVIEATIRNMNGQSARGNTRAAKIVTTLLEAVQRRHQALKDRYIAEVETYMERANAELARLRAAGLPTHAIYPHPDNLCWNMEEAMPYFADAPVLTTAEYRKQLDLLNTMIADIEKELGEKPATELEADLRDRLGKCLRYKIELEARLKS